MNDANLKHAELGRLIAQMMDGDITEEDHRRLETLLTDNPAAQAFYREYLALDSELVWSFDADCTAIQVPAHEKYEWPTEGVTPQIQRVRPRETEVALPSLEQRTNGRRWLLPALLATAIAASLVVLALTLYRPQVPAPAQAPSYARIVELVGSAEVRTAAGEVLEASVGLEVVAGQTIRIGDQSSFAVVEYADRTRLELLADTIARLTTRPPSTDDAGGKQVFVSQGLVRAVVKRQPEGQPMLLRTPHAEIHILGTTFTSAIVPNGTRIEMEKGRVEVVRQADGQTIEVDSGSFVEATLDPALEPMVTRPLPEFLRQPWNVLNTSARDLAYSDDGELLALVWKDRVRFWDTTTWSRLQTLHSKHDEIRSVRFVEDQRALMTTGRKPHGKLWQLPEGRRTTNYLNQRKLYGQTLHIAPGGRAIVWAEPAPNRMCDLKMWEAELNTVRLVGVSPIRDLNCLALSPNWMTLVAGSKKGKLLFLTPGQADSATIESAHRKRIRVLAFSPDGRWLASGSEDGVVKIWNVATRHLVQRLEGQGRQIVSLAFSPDGSLLATGRNDGTVKLWNPVTAEELTTIAHSRRGEVRCLAFAPDGRTLITAIPGRPIFVWNLADEAHNVRSLMWN